MIGVLAYAEPAYAVPTARLVYWRTPGAESCPDEDALRRAVSERVGYDPFFPFAPKTVVASVRPATERGFTASIELIDDHGIAHGARELHTEGECASLLQAAALVIAIAIDPHFLAAQPASPPPPTAPPELSADAVPLPAVDRPKRLAADRPPPPSPARSVEVAIAGGGVASAGVAPEPAFGVSARIETRWRRLSLGLEGRVDAPLLQRSAVDAAMNTGHVSSWLVVGALVSCTRAGLLLGCAVAQGGTMNVQADGFPGARSTSAAWVALGGRFEALLPLERGMSLGVRSDLLADLAPPTLRLGAQGVWSAPRVAGSLGVEVVVPFR